MSLGNKQRIFTRKVADLIKYAYDNGYELTLGDASRLDGRGHIENSFHYKRLAVDFNLFKDGKHLRETDDHLFLGEHWESIGGTWGGRFSRPDGNHYQWG